MKRNGIFAVLIAGLIGGLSSFVLTHQLKEVPMFAANHQQEQVMAQPVSTQTTRFVGSVDFIDAAERSVHAVVHVKVRNKMTSYSNPFYEFLFGTPQVQQEAMPVVSSGSGVIISDDGYIVTNNHVIDGADVLEVTLNDKRTYEAKVVGADPTTDIALIKIDEKDLPFLTWGNSDDLRLGEWVLAVGNPFNLNSTVTAGIVSAKSRSINIINKNTAIEAFIQTDAAVNPGNSGGALVNTAGELIGINTAIASPTGAYSGYSFAVPQKIAQKIASDLLDYGAVQRAFIGVSISDVTGELAKEAGVNTTKGVYISAVAPGGAAQDAGIKKGDIIMQVGQVEVNSTSELQEQVGRYRPGDQIAVRVLRGDKDKEMLLTLRNIDGSTEIRKAGEGYELYGARLKDAPSDLVKKLRIDGGVQIEDLQKGKFEQAGMKEGFIITSVNHEKVGSLDDIRLILNNSKGGVLVEGVYPNGISAYYAFGI